MMLIHKPQFALSSPHSMTLFHRRQSSAPIVVRPTHTPGLLSLSKPPKPSSPYHQQRHNIKNAPKQTLTTPPATPTMAHPHPRNLTPAAQDKNLHNKRSPASGKHNRHQPSPTAMTDFKQCPSLILKRPVLAREFPICDDSSEIADDDDHPSTPIPRRLYVGAPRSVPISARALDPNSYSPPLSPSSPQNNNKNGVSFRNRNHRRSPSDGCVFHMSSDEDVSSGPADALLNTDLNPVLALVNSPSGKTKEMHPTTPVKAAAVRPGVAEVPTMNMSTSLERAAFFASSLFQNSPSPDELPDPLSL